jgi:predicted PurR-regulated permease PerM
VLREVSSIVMEVTIMLDEIKDRLEQHEDRIRKLELSDASMAAEIKNLIEKINDLTGWIKALILTAFPVLLTAIGFLVSFYFTYSKK